MDRPSPLAPARWRTRANALTGTRLLLAPALVGSLLAGAVGWAHGIFWLAVATDLLDGRIARRYDEASDLGGLLDHATDAFFVATGLAALALDGQVPLALPPLVALAFGQYALDSRVLEGRPLRTSALGRWNGVAYFVLLGVPVVRDGLGLGWPPVSLTRTIGWALVASTLLSMAERLRAWLRA